MFEKVFTDVIIAILLVQQYTNIDFNLKFQFQSINPCKQRFNFELDIY